MSSVAIATGYGLNDGGITVLLLAGWSFSLFYNFQSDSGAHSASYLMDTRGLSCRGVELTTQFHLVARLRMAER